MALAGASRIFELMDEPSESDDGYVTLVNVKSENGELRECAERTGSWAWKHPHGDGTLTYTPLRGDIRFFDVDFGYEENKPVLHNITLYAEPGQKVAFVGATGAGKTTITNLINRFYDIADGKIRYDGININKIKKADLRRSLGMKYLEGTNDSGTDRDYRARGPGNRRSHRKRAAPPAGQHRAYRLGKPHQRGRSGRRRQHPDQQVRRGLPRPPLLRRL